MDFSISGQDFLLVGFLVLLEGILSVDNALVLAMLCRHLPPEQQKKALTYGLWGAVGFRILALFFIVKLIEFTWVKFLGGGYLLYIAIREFLKKGDDAKGPVSRRSFWGTVVKVELMDIAFAVDSILAAAALSKKLWVLFTGGVLGIVMMRFAAGLFIRVLKKFPRFETTAFLLIALVGLKLIVEGFQFEGVDFHNPQGVPFIIFWSSMSLAVVFGFFKKGEETEAESEKD